MVCQRGLHILQMIDLFRYIRSISKKKNSVVCHSGENKIENIKERKASTKKKKGGGGKKEERTNEKKNPENKNQKTKKQKQRAQKKSNFSFTLQSTLHHEPSQKKLPSSP